MRSLSSSMTKKLLRSAVHLREPHQVTSLSVVGPVMGAENWRPFCGPGFGGLPEAKPSSTLPKLSLVRSSYVSFQISTIGQFTQAPRHSTSSQLKLPSADRWNGS